MGRVAVVTDSTADLPAGHPDVPAAVVGLSVAFGDDTPIAADDLDTEAFYRRLETVTSPPTTAQPPPVAFDLTYAALAEAGFDAVVSVHCSAALSGTVDVARTRAPHAPLPVSVVDSRVVGGALALVVQRAVRVAREVADPASVVASVEEAAAQVTGLLVVDTLEHLRRGGRLSASRAAVGGLLRVKPLLQLVGGKVELVETARTRRRAFEHAAQRIVVAAAGRPVALGLVHAAAPERADELAVVVAERVEIRERWTAPIGPIVGTHVGPGAVGAAALTA